MNSSRLASHEEEEIVIIDSQDELEEERAGNNFASGSRSRPMPMPQRPAANNRNTDVIDLTGSPEIEIISSNLPPVAPRPAKRPRHSPNKAIRTTAPPPPPPPPEAPASPKGPHCGICLEPMGGNTDRPMMAGTCG